MPVTTPNNRKLYKVDFADIKDFNKFINAANHVIHQGSMVVVLKVSNAGEELPIADIKEFNKNRIKSESGSSLYEAFQNLKAQLNDSELLVVNSYQEVETDTSYNELITAYDRANEALPRPGDGKRYRTEIPINIGDSPEVKKDAKSYTKLTGWAILSLLAAAPTAVLSYLNAAKEADSDAVAGDIFKEKLWEEMNDEQRAYAFIYFISSLLVNVPINITYLPAAFARLKDFLMNIKNTTTADLPDRLQDIIGMTLAAFATLTQFAVSWEGLKGQNFFLRLFLTIPGLLSTFASRFNGSFFALKDIITLIMTLFGKNADGVAQEEIIKYFKRLQELAQQDENDEIFDVNKYHEIFSNLGIDIKDAKDAPKAVTDFIEQAFTELFKAGLDLPPETTLESIKKWVHRFVDYGAMSFVGLTMYPFWAAKAVAGLDFFNIPLKNAGFWQYPISWFVGTGHMLFYMRNALTARETATKYFWQVYETLRDNVNATFTRENLGENVNGVREALFSRFSRFEDKIKTDPYSAFQELAWSLFCIPLYWSGVGLQTSAKGLIETDLAYEYLDPFTSEEWQKAFRNGYVEATNWAVIIVNLKILTGWLTRPYTKKDEINLEAAIKFLEASKTNPIKGMADLLERWEALFKNRDMEVVTSKDITKPDSGETLDTEESIKRGSMSPINEKTPLVSGFNSSMDSNGSDKASTTCNPLRFFGAFGNKKPDEVQLESKEDATFVPQNTKSNYGAIPSTSGSSSDSSSSDENNNNNNNVASMPIKLPKGKAARSGATLDCGCLDAFGSFFTKKDPRNSASSSDSSNYEYEELVDTSVQL